MAERSGRPPWWRWYEWLYVRTCTFCRGIVRYRREQEREASGG